MIIVSQDKDVIVNFDNVGNIWINNPLENDDGKFEIIAENYLNNTVIGDYKTEERAKEILQEIIEFYEISKRYESKNGVIVFQDNKFVYEMPEN